MIEKGAAKEKGFLTAEVMMISLWLVVLAATAGIYIVGGKMIVAARNMTTACFLAERQMVCFQGGELVWHGDQIDTVERQDNVGSFSVMKNKTAFTITTAAKSVATENLLKRIVVCVEWQENGARKEFKLESLVAANGET